jgi:hypothetical protein
MVFLAMPFLVVNCLMICGGGKCPEISTIFALKQAHLPRIVDSTAIDGLRNGSRAIVFHPSSVNSERPSILNAP